MDENYDEDQRTVWCGNLSDKLTEEVLYELFLQAGPIIKIYIPKDKDGKRSTYGFITFKDFVSVQYAVELLNGVALYDKRINIKPRTNNLQRQNSYTPTETTNQQNNVIKSIQDLDMLMKMGDNLLINNKRHNNYNEKTNNQNNYNQKTNNQNNYNQKTNNQNNYNQKTNNQNNYNQKTNNQNNMQFPRYRRPENRNYFDNRHEDSRSNYNMKYRNDDRRNTNHPYSNRRRYDR